MTIIRSIRANVYILILSSLHSMSIYMLALIDLMMVMQLTETCSQPIKTSCNWGDPDLDERIILRLIFRKWEGFVGTGWSWLRIVTGGGHLRVR